MSYQFDDRIRIKHSRRARRLALRLDTKERVINLVIPKGMSLKKAQEFASAHESWIDSVLHELPPVIPFEHDRSIPVLGADRMIVINRDKGRKSTQIDLQPAHLIVHTNKEDPSSRLERYLKNLAREKLTEMAFTKAVDINKEIKSIRIGDMKSRWGSCSEDGRLSFSWRLLFAPSMAMDYVVAHEVAHLIHLNHSRKFWNLCRDLSIDYMEGEYWMRNHGAELMRYGLKTC
ncbi:MAG: M48 family metallopeptidase [Alphaproteobacteria bacterium]